MQYAYRNLIETLINPSEREETMKGMFMRALGWMRTLKKLNHPLDFQAIVSCNRALLEIAVDMLLLYHDKSDASWWKMSCWERSAKLKSAEKIERHYLNVGLAVPEQFSEQIKFINNEKVLILHLREALWNGKHPQNRWTGSPNLLQDIKVVDKNSEDIIKDELGITLKEFYATEYMKMNWNTHGSALAGIRHLSSHTFLIIGALGYKWCADLAMLCTKIILIDYGFASHYTELREKWKQVHEDRLIAYANSQAWSYEIDET